MSDPKSIRNITIMTSTAKENFVLLRLLSKRAGYSNLPKKFEQDVSLCFEVEEQPLLINIIDSSSLKEHDIDDNQLVLQAVDGAITVVDCMDGVSAETEVRLLEANSE